MSHKVTVIGGSGFVGTNLCRIFALKQQQFEIIDLKMSTELLTSANLETLEILKLYATRLLVILLLTWPQYIGMMCATSMNTKKPMLMAM